MASGFLGNSDGALGARVEGTVQCNDAQLSETSRGVALPGESRPPWLVTVAAAVL